jgi:Phosphotransferase enzyme family
MEHLPAAVKEIAAKFGDSIFYVASGFSGKAFVGERYVFRETSLTVPKSATVTDWLRLSQSQIVRLVPEHVGLFEISNTRISVEYRIVGEHPTDMTPSLILELGAFLSELHSIAVPQVFDQFEGERFPHSMVWEWVAKSVLSYGKKLESRDDVSSDDKRLIARAVEQVLSHTNGSPTECEMVLLHKDLHLRNLLVADGRLIGVIDWDAAMLGPREWDLAILQQRFPVAYPRLLDVYSASIPPSVINNKILETVGLVQALRFWKSFPDQKDFVAQQVRYIKQILHET